MCSAVRDKRASEPVATLCAAGLLVAPLARSHLSARQCKRMKAKITRMQALGHASTWIAHIAGRSPSKNHVGAANGAVLNGRSRAGPFLRSTAGALFASISGKQSLADALPATQPQN